MLQGVKLSKTQNPTTTEDRERMKAIPYASAIGSIKYVMLCTRSIAYPTLILARGYNSDLGVDHWTAVKIILSGFIKEELYMMQPEGFVNPKGANKICKLQRSIYGLVQASRSYNIRFDKLIKGYSFIQTCGEACIYKKVSGSTTTFLISICE